MTLLFKKNDLISALLAGLLSTGLVGNAAEIYVSQNGGGDGSSSGLTQSLAWLNSNWSTVNPGDTVHLVGTVGNTLTIGKSGNAGSPITVKFESGAQMSAPFWSPAAIVTGSYSNIVIDGGVNGLIIATANGTGLAYTNTSRGVFVGEPSGPNTPSFVTVQNLTISNMYVRIPGSIEPSPGDLNNATTQGIIFYGSHIAVINNVISGAEVGIAMSSWSPGITNRDIAIFGNQLYRNCISLTGGGDGSVSNSVLSDVNIVSNRLDHWSEWSNPAMQSDIHLDGIYLFLIHGINSDYCTISNLVISHNYFGPDVFAYTTTTNLMISITNQPANLDSLTLTVLGVRKTFTFKNSPSLATDVRIGASTSETADNLKAVLKTFYDYCPQRGNNSIVNFTWPANDTSDAWSQSGSLELTVQGPLHPNNTTSPMFMTWYTTTPLRHVAFNFKVFNNIVVWTNQSDAQTPWASGFFRCNASGNSILANNTVISTHWHHSDGYTYGAGTGIVLSDDPVKIYNNFTKDLSSQILYDGNTYLTNFNSGLASDYNCWSLPITSYVGNNSDFYGPPASVYYGTNTLIINYVSNVSATNNAFTNRNTGQSCCYSAPYWILAGGALVGKFTNTAPVGTYTNGDARAMVIYDRAANGDMGYSWKDWTNKPFFGVADKFDRHSKTSSPLINAVTYQPLASDTVLVNAGTNLTSWGIVNDFYGNPRPATGPWTIGAFQTTSAQKTVLPPTITTATEFHPVNP